MLQRARKENEANNTFIAVLVLIQKLTFIYFF